MMRISKTKREGKKHRRWPIVVLVGVTVVSTTGFAMQLMGDSGVGHFRTATGRQSYVDAYNQAMKALPLPTKTLDVATSYGTVRVYAWINETRPGAIPVLLLPGRSSGVPMWEANLKDFIAYRTVYAFDALGDAGMSIQSVPLKSMEDQAAWVSEVLVGLNIPKVHAVGHSFGGATAAAVAIRHSDQVSTLTLLEPVFTIDTFPAWAWPHVIKASLPFVPRSWREKSLTKIGGIGEAKTASSDPLGKMITAASEHYSAKLPTPAPLSTGQLQGLAMPVYLALASDKSLAGDGAARNARAIPSVQVVVWPDTTHSLPMQAGSMLNKELERFWSAHS